MSTVSLEVSAVVKVLGGARVLRGARGAFEGGAIHVLEGANGSGKSTLLSLLGGRARATSGSVKLLRGGKVVAQGSALRAHVGWLGHELGLYGELTALENVALHADVRGASSAEAWSRWATALSLEPLVDRRVREMSRGQRQRVALARALVGAPEVLLLDEPSTGLDHASVARLVDVLKDLAGQGTLVFVVTHDAPFREQLGGRRWRLVQGLLESGTDSEG